MSSPTLAQTQLLLWKLITAPEGVARGLDELPAAERRLACALVRDRPPLSAIERCDIYANMYFFRIRDVLQDDFPALAGVIGEVEFHNLVTDYLLRHPPSHFSLRHVGRDLPGFVAGHAVVQRWPFLSDLARLEQAIADAFDAPDAPVLRAAELAVLAPADWPQLRLAVTPSLRLLQLDWPVASIWQAAREGHQLAGPEREPVSMRVWRRDLRVFHKPIPPLEAQALAVLREGGTFGTVCEILAAGEDEEAGAQKAFLLLRSWLAEEVLALPHPPTRA